MHVVIALGDHVSMRVTGNNGIPYDVAALILEALTFDNPDYDVARRERNAWGVPEKISFGEIEPSGPGGVLHVPRGVLHQICDGFLELGHSWEIQDNRVAPQMDSVMFPANLRDYQEEAVEELLLNEQGIYKAPPGSGKTVTSLEVARRSGLRTLIIVDKTNIAAQWIQRCEEHFSFRPGLIGDGSFEDVEVTIAMAQTLHSRRDELRRNGFWNEWGTVIFDEMHHVPASTVSLIAQEVKARYLFGVSATPEWTDFRFQVAQALLGPVIHETTVDRLEAEGHLVRPSVHVVDTKFEFPFHGTHRDVHGKLVRNNYNEMLDKLTGDYGRTRQVAEIAANCADAGNVVLIVTARLDHIRMIEDEIESLYDEDLEGSPPVYRLTGETETEARMYIAEVLNNERNGAIVISTIADEALDIPRLDRLIMAWPTSNTALVQQRIGRIARPHKNKVDAVVFDIRDGEVSLLKKQAAKRIQYYHKMGYTVEF